jgi:magnesium transporter
MVDNLVQARVDAIRRLARRRATKPLQKAVEKCSALDVAEAADHLTRPETLFLIDQLSDNMGGVVLLELREADLQLVSREFSLERLTRWLEAMEPDDEADLVGRLPDTLRERLLSRLEAAEREDVEDLLAWPEDSAGGIMSPVVFRIQEDTTCRDAIEAFQEQADVEMIFYLYIENDQGQLVGVTSLRNLLINSPSTHLRDFMTSDVMTVTPETDQEDVANLAARYDLLAVPVADESRKLLGIVTIDDVLDVIAEEAAEDMMAMAGVSEGADPYGETALDAVRSRGRWLVVTLVAGLVMAEVINHFENTLAQNAMLAGFIPVVMGLSGNVGIQAATITVRNLATGRVSPGVGVGALLWKESRTGMLMGLGFGLALATWGFLRYPGWQVGGAVGASIAMTLVSAAVLGSAIPLSLNRFGIDPAVATGPFVTTLVDLIAIGVYFTVCTTFFGF